MIQFSMLNRPIEAIIGQIKGGSPLQMIDMNDIQGVMYLTQKVLDPKLPITIYY